MEGCLFGVFYYFICFLLYLSVSFCLFICLGVCLWVFVCGRLCLLECLVMSVFVFEVDVFCGCF